MPSPINEDYCNAKSDLRSIVDAALARAEAADALPQSRHEALGRAAAAIDKAERRHGSVGASDLFRAADGWIALANAFSAV